MFSRIRREAEVEVQDWIIDLDTSTYEEVESTLERTSKTTHNAYMLSGNIRSFPYCVTADTASFLAPNTFHTKGCRCFLIV